jgi:hypothetical protein
MEERKGLYAYVGILVGFKIWTLIIILYLTSSWDTVIFVLAGHVLWIGAGAVIVAGPAAFWARLVRVRAKRRKLQYAEWHVEDPWDSVHADNSSND